ncbi:MAG TPA: hypothetical protein VGF50_08670 [Caulobacteraceae bacterium]|jgi:hypothetical protein
MSKYLPRIAIGVVAGFVMYYLMSLISGPDLQSVLIGVFGAVAVAGILINLAGNRRLAVAGAAEKAAALALTPPAGKALLVVARRGYLAKLVGLNLSLDGQLFTQLKSPAFTILEVAPGAHTLATGFGDATGAQGRAATFPFEAAAGGVVAVVVTPSIGTFKFAPQTDLDALRRALRGMPMVLPETAPAPAAPAAAPAA